MTKQRRDEILRDYLDGAQLTKRKDALKCDDGGYLCITDIDELTAALADVRQEMTKCTQPTHKHCRRAGK